MRQKKGRFLMTVGLLCILAAFGLTGYNVYESRKAEEISAEAVEQISEQIQILEMEETEEMKGEIPDYQLFPDMEIPTVKVDGERYIGILTIPDIDVSLPIMGGEWSYAKLRKAPCLYAGSVYKNDMIIAGHNYSSHFSKIKSLDAGSKMQFVDVDNNVFTYTVGWIEILQPEDVQELKENTGWDLTLFTCTYGGNERYIVRCNLTE